MTEDTPADGVTTRPQQDPTVGELMTRLSQQTSQLVREEIHLAQAEMREKGKHAGLGLGLFSGAGLLAFFGIATLIACAVLGLAQVLSAWVSALIVGVVLLVTAGVVALTGKQQVQQATPPSPERAVASSKQDVQTIKKQRGTR